MAGYAKWITDSPAALAGAKLHTPPTDPAQYPRDMTVGEMASFPQFPNLLASQIENGETVFKIQVLAAADTTYNCIAHSMGFTDRWIDLAVSGERATKDDASKMFAHFYYVVSKVL
jgi:hypothetical protein